MSIRRSLVIGAVLLLATLAAVYAASMTRTTSVAPTPTASPSVASGTVGRFLDTHPATANAPRPAFGWLLSDISGTFLRREDDAAAAVVLPNVREFTTTVSPAGRHLSYWTAEARGVRRLHVLDTVTLTPPLTVLETQEYVKLSPAYSPDERFAAIPVPDRAGLIRIVELTSGDAQELTTAADARLGGWIAEGLVLGRSGGTAFALLDLRTGATSDIAATDPRLQPAPRPTFDPGSTLPIVEAKFERPDASATTYLRFDSTQGGRWYGERVERGGARTPVEWTTGGNPVQQLYVGTESPRATVVYDPAPAKAVDGRPGEERALWLMRQNVSGRITREAVRAVPYADEVAATGSRSYQIPLDVTVYVVALQASYSANTHVGEIQCGHFFAFLRSDGNSEGTGGGCGSATWPTNLPSTFASPHRLDWASPTGPATPAPTSK